MLNEGPLHKLAWRARFLFGPNPFSFWERLAYVNPLGPALGLAELVDRSHRRDRNGEPYFGLAGLKLYYRPEMPFADEPEYLDSVRLILRESYLRPDYFSPEVRIAPGDRVLDLGGNIGTTALAFSRLAGPTGQVYTFEPVTDDVLRRNVQANRVTNVHVLATAVADRCGEAEIEISGCGIDSSIARSPGGSRPALKRKVPLTTVDRFVEQEGLDRVDFIKMDIEGAEELALRGSAQVIERFRPRWTIASYHTDHVGEKQHPKLLKLLRDFGYQTAEGCREGKPERIYAW